MGKIHIVNSLKYHAPFYLMSKVAQDSILLYMSVVSYQLKGTLEK